MAQPYLSIIIPAKDEALRLPATLVDIDRRLADAEYSYEIMVVVSKGSDNTPEIVENMKKLVRNLKLVDLAEDVGKGGAVRQGMLLSSGNIRLFMDADNSTTIDQFANMMPFFKEGYDVVIGSRTAKGAKCSPKQPLYRQIAGKIGNLVSQLVLGLWGVWDMQCGFKAFTAEAAEKIFNEAKVRGWGFDAEVLAIAKRKGYKTKEIPVIWANDPRSHLRLPAYLQVLAETCRIRWWLMRGGYATITNDQ